jgi:hypothetical protein
MQISDVMITVEVIQVEPPDCRFFSLLMAGAHQPPRSRRGVTAASVRDSFFIHRKITTTFIDSDKSFNAMKNMNAYAQNGHATLA